MQKLTRVIKILNVQNSVIESEYPINFRQKEALELGQNLRSRQSVVLIGMKRVGISNFLRFFIYHKDIANTYIKDKNRHLFIPVDLNDLVELEIYPVWTLTLKRIVDVVEESILPKEIKKKIETLFLDTIQSQDLFLAIESVRKSLARIVENGFLPTLFFIRFDRIKNAVTPEFFANLQGIREATNHRLCYVFTSFRSLDILAPQAFSKSSFSAFARNIYIKPASIEDTQTIFKMYRKMHSRINLSPKIEGYLFDIVDGYVQYLQLALTALEEKTSPLGTRDEIFEYLAKDERIVLASEEIWESLDQKEKDILTKLISNQKVDNQEQEENRYLWDTGVIIEENNGAKRLFSPLFNYYVQQGKKRSTNHLTEFTKKENILFNFLKNNYNAICEREKIVESVWPEVESLGVSDWAIDRLIARVRSKLKLQKSQFEIQTVRTRGYKLIPS